ncbi:MAG TPA: TIGR02147 family protein [Fibrobacteria bacterium]|nr:TIGR02147 family protein [Fibrobacteria bacterium]
MVDLYQYTDYRKYLRDYYEAKRASQKEFTHRYIAQAIGFKSTGTFAQILQGKTNISPQTILHFVRFLALKKDEADYFELLVLFNQGKSHAEKKRYFERIISFPKSNLKQVDSTQYAFYEKWYYSVIRETLAFHPFVDDFRELARLLMPPIATSEAQKAIRLLEELGLIRKNEGGVYEKSDPVITSGYDTRSLAVNQFIIETLDLAKVALDELPRDERSLSALTLSLPEDGYAMIEEKVKNFRRELLELARNCAEPKRVIQVNFQIFPVTRKPDEGKHEA